MRQRDPVLSTARERVDYLLDEGTFEGDRPPRVADADDARDDRLGARRPSDGVVTGYGDRRPLGRALIATDFTVSSGSIGHAGGRKMSRVAERALDRGRRCSCSTTAVATASRRD